MFSRPKCQIRNISNVDPVIFYNFDFDQTSGSRSTLICSLIASHPCLTTFESHCQSSFHNHLLITEIYMFGLVFLCEPRLHPPRLPTLHNPLNSNKRCWGYVSIVFRDNLQTRGNRPFYLCSSYYTQSPIIKNGPIRNNAEILGKFKERTLSRSKIRNEQFPSK